MLNLVSGKTKTALFCSIGRFSTRGAESSTNSSREASPQYVWPMVSTENETVALRVIIFEQQQGEHERAMQTEITQAMGYIQPGYV
jgi:hypothetical protein